MTHHAHSRARINITHGQTGSPASSVHGFRLCAKEEGGEEITKEGCQPIEVTFECEVGAGHEIDVALDLSKRHCGLAAVASSESGVPLKIY